MRVHPFLCAEVALIFLLSTGFSLPVVGGESPARDYAPDFPSSKSAWIDPATGMTFVWVPGGKFKIGLGAGRPSLRSSFLGPVEAKRKSTSVIIGNRGRTRNTGPEVEIKGFWIGKYEMTKKQWRQITHAPDGNRTEKENYPATLTWDQVEDLLQVLNTSRPGLFRLPTETEWEYACRSGVTNEDMGGGAWHKGTVLGAQKYGSQPVGTKAPNRLGIHDMRGNVWEWVQKDLAALGAETGSEGPSAAKVRGGSWLLYPFRTRCSHKNTEKRRGGGVGVRLVMSRN